MIKEVKIKGLRKTDRVFQKGKTRVKIRLLSKEIHSKNKLYGPAAISLRLSACICDRRGKALADAKGNYAIYPHTLTLPLSEVDTTKADIRKGLKKALDPLIEKTIMWKKARDAAAQVIEEWQEPGS